MSKSLSGAEPVGQVTRVLCTIIGGGVIGTSLANGLHAAGGDAKEINPGPHQYRIRLVTRREEHAAYLQQRYPGSLVTSGVRSSSLWESSPCPEAFDLHVVLICTQPQFTRDVCADLKAVFALAPPHVNPNGPNHAGVKPLAAPSTALFASPARTVLEIPTVFVTACPGIQVSTLASWLPPNAAIVRTMPNTPARIRQGATAAFASPTATAIPGAVEAVAVLLQHVSPALCFVPTEDLLDVAASVSGSAPAYAFTLMQALVGAGVRRGLPADLADALVKQSVFGSAGLSLQVAGVDCLERLTDDVCVPGGSTEKAMAALRNEGFSRAVEKGVEVSLAANRAMSEA